MGLPTSREITAAPNAALPSSVINAIQDCIVGAKHPPLTLPIGASTWRSKLGATPTDGLHWDINASGEQLWHDLVLPVGTRLVQVTFYYQRSGSGGNPSMKVRKAVQGAGAWTDIQTFTDTTTTTNQQKILTCNEVIVAATQYQLYFDDATGGAGTDRLDFATITIDRL